MTSSLRRVGNVPLLAGVLAGFSACASAGRVGSPAPATAPPSQPPAVVSGNRDREPPPLELDLARLLAPGPELTPAPAVREASGQRVRLVGFMVRMDLPPQQGFFLTRRPLVCDEAGGGTADLPPDAVRVIVPWYASDRAVTFVPGPIEVIGRFEVGNREEADGRTSAFRVTLDRPDTAVAFQGSVQPNVRNPQEMKP